MKKRKFSVRAIVGYLLIINGLLLPVWADRMTAKSIYNPIDVSKLYVYVGFKLIERK
jgi:hypothetical protein